LLGATSVDAVLDRLRSGGLQTYTGRFGEGQRVLYWSEDAAFEAVGGNAGAGPEADAEAERMAAPRHRLVMERRPWVYERTF
jgi:hypothetical protein